MKNRFNRLTSKEWLPFQKSWCRADDKEKMLREAIRFFVRADENASAVYYYGSDASIIKKICKEEKINFTENVNYTKSPIDFVCIDLLDLITTATSIAEYQKIKAKVLKDLLALYPQVDYKKFVSIWIPNIQSKKKYYPFAWDIAAAIGDLYSLKDEKIAGYLPSATIKPQPYFFQNQLNYYCLYFKKDDASTGVLRPQVENNFFKNIEQVKGNIAKFSGLPAWYILKPAPRKKDEIRHPAKYPEELVVMYLKQFTSDNDHVFDPMSGTGSTQVACLHNNRNAYGTELSSFFAEIAINRCSEINIEIGAKKMNFKILNKDARKISKRDIPTLDYIITSPPYWDMLNMKGAENQAKRIEKGLQTNYSDNTEDLGNINDYQHFLDELISVYRKLIPLLKPGAYLTIVVKNIKKKGKNYPFAWDLSNALMRDLILLPETFWCQDDISIAPYGYGNTFVTNTFHQYCLTFQKGA